MTLYLLYCNTDSQHREQYDYPFVTHLYMRIKMNEYVNK